MAEALKLPRVEYITTPEGKTTSVILSIEDWMRVSETLKIMSNKELVQSVKRAKRQLHTGAKLLTFEEVFENL